MFRTLLSIVGIDSGFSLAHDKYFNQLRDREYARLSDGGHVYLDYTGGGLYSDTQIDQHHKMLRTSTLGNPHSTNPTSQLATQRVEEARQAVLDYFRADDYYCVFTQNASAALKIVGECYPFGAQSHLLLLTDNHNSVNGIREYCKSQGGNCSYAPIRCEDLTIDKECLISSLEKFAGHKHKLFAYPAQSNVTGVKHDLRWISEAHQQGWDVLLDAAAFVPTSHLDLSLVKPDFISMSFYKMFGYPTGLGCLLVKKSKFGKLQKPWFAGGTVDLASVRTQNHFLADHHERFEDGTINYLDIPALKIGLDHIETIGINRISERVHSLMMYLYGEIKSLKHDSGISQVNVLGPQDRHATGGTLALTFRDINNQAIPFEIIEQRANRRMISIRSGCFCNPGVDEVNNRLTAEELSCYFSSRDKGNYHDMTTYLNKMRGATRVSVGLATTKGDLDTFIDFVQEMRNKPIEEL